MYKRTLAGLSGGLKDIFKADTWKVTSESLNDVYRGIRDIRDVAVQALPVIMPELAPFASLAQSYINTGSTPQQAYELAYQQSIAPAIASQYPPGYAPAPSAVGNIPTEYFIIGGLLLLLLLLR